MSTSYLVEMNNISKSFSGVSVLKDVHLNLYSGEVLGLIGENGAGKSTLMNILSGLFPADHGEIFFNGQRLELQSIGAGIDAGISFIHQELSMVPSLTIQQNFFLGIEETKGLFLNKPKMAEETRKALQKLGLTISPDVIVGKLSVAQQQLVEIAKAISFNSSVIIMDEPTTSLTENETDYLFNQIHQLKKEGISIIFISHKLEELLHISDRITVLRDGTYIDTVVADDIDEDHLIKMMVGRELSEIFLPRNIVGTEEAVLEVDNISNGKINSISFTLRKGEILGVAGLVGSGRSELADALFGIDPIESGSIKINGLHTVINKPEHAIQNGLAYVTEDRKVTGLFVDKSIRYNITLPIIDSLYNKFLYDGDRENEIITNSTEKFKIKMINGQQLINQLSGGNQQKVVLSKWLATQPDILILDEPTKGIDVGAKTEIYKIINQLAQNGLSIIMISSEMNEIINLSNRVLVMHNGMAKTIIDSSSEEFNQESILFYATGGRKDEQY